jgi:hypothetical protein
MSQAELSRKNDVSFQQVQNTRVEPGGLEAAGCSFCVHFRVPITAAKP